MFGASKKKRTVRKSITGGSESLLDIVESESLQEENAGKHLASMNIYIHTPNVERGIKVGKMGTKDGVEREDAGSGKGLPSMTNMLTSKPACLTLYDLFVFIENII